MTTEKNETASTETASTETKKKETKKPAAKKTETPEESKGQIALPLAGAKTPIGTKALAAKVHAMGNQNVSMIDPKFLVVNHDDNPRSDYGDMDELKESILQNGVLVPLCVKLNEQNNYEVVDGFRRATACLDLLKDKKQVGNVPVIILSKNTDDKLVMIRRVVSNQGKPFTPIEEAQAYKSMQSLGMSTKEIGQKTGYRERRVIFRMKLLQACEPVRAALHEGKISLATAKFILKEAKQDEEAQKKLLAKALTGALKKATSADTGKDTPADESGSKLIAAGAARKLLSDLASAFTDFQRSKGPAKEINKSWVTMNTKLKEVRKLNRLGLLK